ncbi:MAG: DNA methyltransferase [Ignavibacteriales bacterium]|nr:DNA methyltransferase [Ignavibacteriales bacterium]
MNEITLKPNLISDFLGSFIYRENEDLFATGQQTKIEHIQVNGSRFPAFINEFWTSKQRQSSSIHEVSYRACFKAQLPRFFIQLLTKEEETVYDPFSGRGTTLIEAGILRRTIVGNDINPLSKMLTRPRLSAPDLLQIEALLNKVPILTAPKSDVDLSMFFHPQTLKEILSIRMYLQEREKRGLEDDIDRWIRMVATNRLTGHSKGFFSVYSLPPNQAISAEKQTKINELRKQKPEYRDTRSLIVRKTRSLLSDITQKELENLRWVSKTAVFLAKDARETQEIPPESIQLTVTSPPFLDVVQYAEDNWLRCWFNHIDAKGIEKRITMSKRIDEWNLIMQGVFNELFRITRRRGFVAFEVGEVRGGKIKLEEHVIPLGLRAGFSCVGVMINTQRFTKTANIWGISNNQKGTNTNRIVLFAKE